MADRSARADTTAAVGTSGATPVARPGLVSCGAWLIALGLLLWGCGPEPKATGLSIAATTDSPSRGLAAAERRAARIAEAQRRAGPTYAFETVSGRQVAHNLAHRWRLTVDREGIEIDPLPSLASWSFGLRLAGVGRGERQPEMADAAAIETDGNRARLDHGPTIESWYLNGPLGLEHGLVLAEPPPRPWADGPLEAAFELTGSLTPSLEEPAGPIALRDSSGRTVLRYGELFARDATGRALPARLELDGRLVWLVIDDTVASYPVLIDPLVWGQGQKVLSSDGTLRFFGAAVAMSADTAIIGAAPPPFGSSPACAAHVYIPSGLQWAEQQILISSTEPGCRLGSAVAISADTALVGEPARDQVGTAGMAYLFVRSAGSWSQQHLAQGETDWDHFGSSVSLDGDTALIGASGEDDGAVNDTGSAYVLVRSAAAWTEQAQLLASDRAAADQLGGAVSLSGDTAFLGAVGADGNAPDSGAVYAFVRVASTWSEQDKLVASDGASGDGFGRSISVFGDTALIGADGATGVAAGTGAAYVFVRSASSWTEQDKLSASDGGPGDALGSSVSLLGDAATVGAKNADGSVAGAGAAYEFARSASSWTEVQRIIASDGNFSGEFGAAVARSADWVWVGAPRSDGLEPDEGAAYTFRYALDAGSVCTLSVECVSGHCVEGLCCDRPCSGACAACDLSGNEGHCAPLPVGSAGEPSCAPYGCDGSSESCPEACDDDTDCATTHHCQSSLCVASKALGESCDEGRECEAGHCVEGVCCDDECSGGCESCLAVLQGGGSDGTCAPVRAGDDPWDRCPVDSGFPQSCLADGACDGQGSCRALAPAGVSCGEGLCAHELLVPAVCDGAGQCLTDPELASEDCSPYQCAEPGVCPTSCASSADCVSGHICDWQSRCVAPPARSTAEGSCGVAAGGGSRRSGVPALLLGLLALGVTVRRSRPRRTARAGERVLRRPTLPVVLAVLLGGCGSERTGRQDAGEHSRPFSVDHAEGATRAVAPQTRLVPWTEGGRPPRDSRALVWVEQAKLSASNSVGQAHLGWSVALSGDTALVGAPHDEEQATAAGAAYVFVRNAGDWSEQQKLLANDGAAGRCFGAAAAIEGDTALLGAPHRQQGVPGAGPGAVYQFVRSANTWTEQDKLTADNPTLDDGFGWSIALEGDTALVGATSDDELGFDSGAAYVLLRSASTWSQQQKLTWSYQGAEDYFGFSVALSGDVAVVGAPNGDGVCSGQDPDAYIFSRSASTFVEDQYLITPSGTTSGFGASVAASGSTVLVGEPCAFSVQGKVHAYLRGGSGWSEPSTFTPSNIGSMPAFGIAVGLAGDTALVGAFMDDAQGTDSGSAYVFTRSADSWTEDFKLLASDGEGHDEFGSAIALSSDSALVAAYRADGEVGAAYVFRYALSLGSVCTTGSECEAFVCSDGVCCDGPCDGACETCTAPGQQGTCEIFVAGVAGEAGCVYRCDGQSGLCPTSCGDDGDCIASHTCELDQCVPRPLGSPCADDSECDTGHCVDEVCCDAACASSCESCLAALKGSGEDGICGPVPAGTDPRDDCDADPGGPSCGGDGLCDGQGSCRTMAPAGTPCEASPCDGPRIVSSHCDDEGHCVGETSQDCSPYQCALPGECLTACASSGDCVEGLICDWQSRCVVPPTAGEADGGCGCRWVGRVAPSGWGAGAALLGVLLLGRVGRRRRVPRGVATSNRC